MEKKDHSKKDIPLPVKRTLEGSRGEWFLGVLSFTESSFLPVLADPFLLAATLHTPKHWVRFAFITTVTSILGGLFGYAIGAVFFDIFGAKLIAFYSLEEPFAQTVATFGSNAFVFTLIGAITPIPYKLVAIVGGFLHISVWQFILASIIGRGLRYFVVAFVVKQYGVDILGKFNIGIGKATVFSLAFIMFYAVVSIIL